jgi:hypothetical protein
MIHQVVEYHNDEWDVRLVVTQATVREGVTRTIRQQVARSEVGDTPPDPKLDPVGFGLYVLQVMTLPDLLAATIEQSGLPSWPLSFEDFLTLPDSFNSEWEQAVYKLNPHWLNLEPPPDEKKATG